MKAHEFYKGQLVQSICELATEEETYPARTRFKVLDVIVRHKSAMIPGHVFPGRVQLKLSDAKPRDPFKTKKPVKPLNVIEDRPNENFPFVKSNRLDNKPKP